LLVFTAKGRIDVCGQRIAEHHIDPDRIYQLQR
jgi:hypothetical protein